ncbi:MAG: hypothetical protein ONB13_06415 [candidate division KSB1 bacterium]|nr:hypothetical protein [candidate division KSB1 bacterium]
MLTEVFDQFGTDRLTRMLESIKERIAAGKLRSVDPKQTLWNIVALNVFYFVFKPFLRAAWPEDIANESQLLQEREHAIIDLLLYGLLPR